MTQLNPFVVIYLKQLNFFKKCINFLGLGQIESANDQLVENKLMFITKQRIVRPSSIVIDGFDLEEVMILSFLESQSTVISSSIRIKFVLSHLSIKDFDSIKKLVYLFLNIKCQIL